MGDILSRITLIGRKIKYGHAASLHKELSIGFGFYRKLIFLTACLFVNSIKLKFEN